MKHLILSMVSLWGSVIFSTTAQELTAFDQVLEFYNNGDDPNHDDLRGVFSGRFYSQEMPNNPQRVDLSCSFFQKMFFGCLLHLKGISLTGLVRWLARDDTSYTPITETILQMQAREEFAILEMTSKILVNMHSSSLIYSDQGTCDFTPSFAYRDTLPGAGRFPPITRIFFDTPSDTVICYKMYRGHIVFIQKERGADHGSLITSQYKIVEVGYLEK